MDILKIFRSLIVFCLLFLAGIVILKIWNYISGEWMPDWMRKFLIFDEVKHIFFYEATRRFNIIGMIIVIFTRGWFYLGIIFVPLNYLNEKLFKEELYSLSKAMTISVLATVAMMIYPFVFDFPDYGQCYTVMFEIAGIGGLIWVYSDYKEFTETSTAYFAKQVAEGMKDLF